MEILVKIRGRRSEITIDAELGEFISGEFERGSHNQERGRCGARQRSERSVKGVELLLIL